MKTSNKYVLAALGLLLSSLTAFNLSLRAEYRRGTYKDPLRNTTALKFANFTAVNVQGAASLKVKIGAGPFGVRVRNDAAAYVKVSQQGARLTIALAFPDELHYLGGDIVTVSCPQLNDLTVSSLYTIKGRPLTDRQQGHGGNVQVQSFTADSLRLRQDDATRVELSGNHLGYLRAEAGASPGSHSLLFIGPDNRVQAADMSVQHQSELQLASRIQQLRFQFGDSTKAVFSGSALGVLRK